jgi:SSS family solute:Na+ symporter
MAFMTIVQKTFPGWTLGLVGGAGALACMIPAADLILTLSMLFSRNVLGKSFGFHEDHDRVGKLAKMTVLGATVCALALAIYAPNMLVNLLLTGYSGVTQFFPLVVLGLFWKKSTRTAAWVSLIVGEAIVFFLILGKMDPMPLAGMNLNAGFVALVVNLIVFIAVSLMTYDEKTADTTWRAD